MGVKFGVADSSNLISAMRNNVSVAHAIVDRLNSGSQHLITHLDAGVLQGAAYTAGRGLFGDLIVPAIAKLGQAIDDIQAELTSYEHAHSVVAEHGDLDLDDLTTGLATAEEQLRLTEEQLERNRDFFRQVQAFVTGELPGLALRNEALERLRERLENTIREHKTKIEKLEWFVADVSNYFSDSLQVMQLATQAAIELNNVAVEADGTYYTNGVNLALIRALNGANVTTRESSIETLMELYGFTEAEAAKILLAQSLYLKSGEHTDEHEFLAMMAALCGSCRATRWTITAGTGSLRDAKEYFAGLGLTAKDVDALVAAVNRQHADASSSGRKDFAHELVGLAIFTTQRGATPAGFMDFVMAGQLNEFASYKGDIVTEFGRDDMQSDTDMINIYQRSLKPGASVLQAMGGYNSELASGETNRAQEMIDSLGGGDFERLKSVLAKEVESYNLGDEEMSGYRRLQVGMAAGYELPLELFSKKLEAYQQLKRDGLATYLQFLEEELRR